MSELRDTLIQHLAEILDAEQQLLRALPKMEQAAAAGELKAAFADHREETEGHIERLKEVFEGLGAPAKPKKCAGMQGLIAEGEQKIAAHEGDAPLLALAQKIEHYEICSYGTLRSWASLLEEEEAAEALSDILEEEKATDERLTELAESTINIEAAEEEAGMDEEEEEEEVKKPRRHE